MAFLLPEEIDHMKEEVGVNNEINEQSSLCSIASIKTENVDLFYGAEDEGKPMKTETESNELDLYPENVDLKSEEAEQCESNIKLEMPDEDNDPDVYKNEFAYSDETVDYEMDDIDDRPYKCDQCERAFKCVGHLNHHLRVHAGDRPHKCDVCGRSYTQASYLVCHMRIHTGEKPYKCEMCDKSFRRKDRLNDHVRTHTGEKPYTCPVCNKDFTQNNHLVMHKRSHTGEKPYKCDFCDKAFSRADILKIHVRIHTKEKPYKCDVCGKGCAQKGHLDKHMRTHTGKKPYMCGVCCKEYSASDKLNSHMKMHLRERENELSRVAADKDEPETKFKKTSIPNIKEKIETESKMYSQSN